MVIKEIDEQGRVVIPCEWRLEKGLMAKSKVELTKDEEKILIRPLKYKSLMELRGALKKKISLEEIEEAEGKAAVKRFEKAR